MNMNTYYEEIAQKAIDLVESLKISNVKWTDWERRFIGGFAEQVIAGDTVDFTEKQKSKIIELWDKL